MTLAPIIQGGTLTDLTQNDINRMNPLDQDGAKT